MIAFMRKIAPHIVGPAIIAVGLAVYIGEAEVRGNLATTSGMITSREVWKSRKSYHVRVAYSYIVESKSYESDRIGMASIFYSRRDDADAAVAPYKPGTAVTVYYNRTNPGTAYLEVEGAGNGEYAIMLGVFVSLVISPVTMLIRRRAARDSAEGHSS